jgi:hypothetical protein
MQSIVPMFYEDGVSSSHWIAGTPFCAALPKDSNSTARKSKSPVLKYAIDQALDMKRGTSCVQLVGVMGL